MPERNCEREPRPGECRLAVGGVTSASITRTRRGSVATRAKTSTTRPARLGAFARTSATSVSIMCLATACRSSPSEVVDCSAGHRPPERCAAASAPARRPRPRARARHRESACACPFGNHTKLLRQGRASGTTASRRCRRGFRLANVERLAAGPSMAYQARVFQPIWGRSLAFADSEAVTSAPLASPNAFGQREAGVMRIRSHSNRPKGGSA